MYARICVAAYRNINIGIIIIIVIISSRKVVRKLSNNGVSLRIPDCYAWRIPILITRARKRGDLLLLIIRNEPRLHRVSTYSRAAAGRSSKWLRFSDGVDSYLTTTCVDFISCSPTGPGHVASRSVQVVCSDYAVTVGSTRFCVGRFADVLFILSTNGASRTPYEYYRTRIILEQSQEDTRNSISLRIIRPNVVNTYKRAGFQISYHAHV